MTKETRRELFLFGAAARLVELLYKKESVKGEGRELETKSRNSFSTCWSHFSIQWKSNEIALFFREGEK
jgi:hypothetical protein